MPYIVKAERYLEGGWCGSGSVNVQFDINLATSVTAVRW